MRAVAVLLALLLAGCATRDQAGPVVDQRPVAQAPPGDRAAAVAPDRGAPLPLTAATPEGAAEPILRRGTGIFVRPAPSPSVTAGTTADGDVTLNFVNADLREVVRVVLGDILGLNYAVSPEVGGTVTIQTVQPIPRAAVLDAFERALQLAGAAIIASENLLQVVPREAALQAGAAVDRPGGAAGPGFGVDILPLDYIGAPQLQELVQPVLSPETVVQVDTLRNLLLVAGTQAQRASVAELAQAFDVDWLRGQSVGLFPLEFANAEQIAGELRAIVTADEADPLQGVIRITPVERLNAILAVTTQPDYLDRVADWVEQLDQGLGETSPQVFVYYVQNGRAADLAAVLTEIFAPGTRVERPLGEVAPGRIPLALTGGPRSRDLGLQPGLGTDTGRRRSGSLGTLGRTSARESGAQAAQLAQQPRLPAPAEVQQPAPPPPPPAELGAPAGDAPGPQLDPARAGDVLVPAEAPIRIIADETNNALVILATPRDYRQVEAALRRLDILPLQVLIEATIAEVTLNDQLEYGLQWFFESGEFALRLSEARGGGVNPNFPGFAAVFDNADARVVLSALASVTDLNVISAPQVLVLDNQTAVLQVGDQVPVPVQQVRGLADVDAPVVNTIEFRDTGTILLVTPRVNTSGLVILEVEQEVSDAIRTVTSGIDSPTIQRRLIQTTVAVESGETLALGGLIRDRNEATRAGVPILMDIPILGALFRRTDDSTQRNEILVLITPRVVRNTEQARAVTAELRQRLQSLAPLEAKVRAPAPRRMLPRLPPPLPERLIPPSPPAPRPG